jgi:hypothetical protein
MPEALLELRQREFDSRQIVRELRRAVFEHDELDVIGKLTEAERELQQISDLRAVAEAKAGVNYGQIVALKEESNLLGANTTGIEATVDLRMACVPTALVHLFDSSTQPLVTYRIRNANAKTKRLRLISYVEGYSASAVDTCEVEGEVNVSQLPTFFPQNLSSVTELTRASVNVEVQDLDAKTEIHKTVPVWLLARTTAPLQVQDPSTGAWLDMTKYLGAFVTPNAPSVMKFVRIAVDKHPQKRLVGYQGDENEVTSQVRAIYEALATSGVKYVNSIIDFTPEAGSATQRVRLARESVENTSANCIDGTVLMASLLEAVSLNPAIVLVPGHAFLAWEAWRNSSKWRYVETTMISIAPFEDACARAEQVAAKWQASSGGPSTFKRLSVRDLRAQGITPME